MINLNEAGMATFAVGVAALAVFGSTAGASLAADHFDAQPDSTFYALERAGEGLKEPILGGQKWEINRGQERTAEFSLMVQKGKSEDFTPLVEEAETHFANAIETAKDNTDLKKISEVIQKHLNVLENLENNVPEVARPKIALAQEQSSRYIKVLDNLKNKGISIGGKLTESGKKTLDNKIGEIKKSIQQEKERLENLIEKAPDKGKTIDEIVNEIENRKKEIKEPKPSEKPGKKEEITVSGIVNELEVTTWMYGTHSLVNNETQELLYALKSETINLDDYIGKKVEIEGTLIHSGVDTGPPYVNVEKITILNKSSGETSDNKNENKTPGPETPVGDNYQNQKAGF